MKIIIQFEASCGQLLLLVMYLLLLWFVISQVCATVLICCSVNPFIAPRKGKCLPLIRECVPEVEKIREIRVAVVVVKTAADLSLGNGRSSARLNLDSYVFNCLRAFINCSSILCAYDSLRIIKIGHIAPEIFAFKFF